MNILLLAPQPFYQDRGTPIAVKVLVQTLGEQGHDVHLLVFAEGEEIVIPHVTIHRHISLPGISNIKPGLSVKKLICDFFLFLKCVQLVRKHEFQIVHAVEESVFMAMVIKKIFKIPYVYDMDSCMSLQLIDKFPSLGLVRRTMQWLEKAAIVNSKGVLAVCRSLEEMVKKYAPDKLTARIEDITLLESGNEGEEDLREELGIQGILLMYVGNFEKYQGIDLLLDGFKEAVLRKKDLRLVLIGGNKKDIQLYKQRSIKLGIATNVFFCGQRPVNMLGYYLGQADILVSPRIQGNNTPMKIYSYLDSGRPVVATNLPTHTQVLDEEIACLVRPTPANMADGIVALAENKVLREKIGYQARRRVQEEYSLPAFQRKLATFYEKLQG
ncbi:MAG: glycosyltransferase family 4 protein [Proteobacteria bacterium]|nr:glycosyltransferase family 4 protein [Pseudomonadota bacterium]MBU1650484.1 glycosyltransferase family 4 protein [Pseudomonadota bacterium]